MSEWFDISHVFTCSLTFLPVFGAGFDENGDGMDIDMEEEFPIRVRPEILSKRAR